MIKQADEHISRDHVLQLTNVPSLSVILTEKRLCWIGHALQRDIADHSRNNVAAELDKKLS